MRIVAVSSLTIGDTVQHAGIPSLSGRVLELHVGGPWGDHGQAIADDGHVWRFDDGQHAVRLVERSSGSWVTACLLEAMARAIVEAGDDVMVLHEMQRAREVGSLTPRKLLPVWYLIEASSS